MNKKEKYARFFLSRVPGVGPAIFRKILLKYTSAENFINDENSAKQLFSNSLIQQYLEFKRNYDFEKDLTELQKRGIDFFVYGEEDYPLPLQNISSPPICLYYLGKYEKEDFTKCISIVGTRKMSDYGKRVTKKFAEGLAQAGFVIVSGMAQGVDRQAHLSALSAGRRSIAVLASSPDVPTPLTNRDLYNKILGNGAVISETFLDQTIASGSFPKRNRIIAGLSSATLVIEAGERSGALITARIAFDENRQVFAVPGNIGQAMSKGTNQIIKEGKAKLVENVDDVISELGYICKTDEDKSSRLTYEGRDSLEKNILDLLRIECSTVDQINKKLEKGLNEILSCVSILELEGAVEKGDDGKYRIVI